MGGLFSTNTSDRLSLFFRKLLLLILFFRGVGRFFGVLFLPPLSLALLVSPSFSLIRSSESSRSQPESGSIYGFLVLPAFSASRTLWLLLSPLAESLTSLFLVTIKQDFSISIISGFFTCYFLGCLWHVLLVFFSCLSVEIGDFESGFGEVFPFFKDFFTSPTDGSDFLAFY